MSVPVMTGPYAYETIVSDAALPVLTGMGFSGERARASLRFSFSRFNTDDEITRGIEIVLAAVGKVRSLMPA